MSYKWRRDLVEYEDDDVIAEWDGTCDSDATTFWYCKKCELLIAMEIPGSGYTDYVRENMKKHLKSNHKWHI